MTRLKPLNAVDAGFLRLESTQTPMHVAGLEIFSLPAKAPPDFLEKLVAEFRSPSALRAPFNLKLNPSPLSALLPTWIEDHDVDLDYHVRHLALPRPGGERELGVLVSRLHSHLLDRSRPLWECYVIEGLEDNRFALYFKIHHALTDGVGGTRLFMNSLADSPEVTNLPPFWAAREAGAGSGQGDEAAHAERSEPPPLKETLQGLAGAVKPLLRQDPKAERVVLPFEGPMSVLNGRVHGTRRFATQQFDLARLKKLTKANGATLNDIVLAMCSGALRRYLKEANQLPSKPLIAGCPVNLRPAGDASGGNAVGYLFANLATDVADPARRFKAIRDSAKAAKEHLQGMPKHVLQPYTFLMMTPMILVLIAGLAGRSRPPINITISNVPGPDQPKYFNGAKLEAPYPVSIPTHGQAVNITCLSYAGTVNFGFTGCRDSLPHLQRLAVYTAEALDELEDALRPSARGSQRESAASQTRETAH